MKKKSVFTSLFLILFSLQLHAGTIEVGQWIPWSSVVQEAKAWPLGFQTAAQNFMLQWQEWKPQALQTDFVVAGQLGSLAITKEGIQASATGMSASLKVGRLALDQTVVKEIGGNRIEIHIKASCQPFEIKVPTFDLAIWAPFQKTAVGWGPALTDLKLGVHDGWSVSDLTCEGPMGIEDRVTAIIQDSLKNSEALSSLLKNYLAPELQKRWQAAWLQITSEKYKDLQITSTSEPMDEGFFLRGIMAVGNGDWKVALPAQLSVLSNVKSPQLVISNEGFAALAKENLGKFSIQKYDLQQVPAFNKLMHSRLSQLFVWSDLLHFGRNTPFYLSTKPDQNVQVQAMGGGQWQVQMQTRGVIEVSRKGKNWSYINWGVGLSSVASTEVKDSKLILQSGQPQTNLSWAFDPAYLAAFKPNGISAKVLKKAAEAVFTSRSTEVELPSLTINNKLWKLNGWVEDRGLIWMEWR